MKVLSGLTIFIVALGLMLCFMGWVAATDFLIFDILLMLALIALTVVVVAVVLIVIIWIIKEFII